MLERRTRLRPRPSNIELDMEEFSSFRKGNSSGAPWFSMLSEPISLVFPLLRGSFELGHGPDGRPCWNIPLSVVSEPNQGTLDLVGSKYNRVTSNLYQVVTRAFISCVLYGLYWTDWGDAKISDR